MKLYILGSGGSEGIPVAFCNCKICKSGDRRRRVGYVVETNNTSFWLELSPDFREQSLEYEKLPDYFYISHIHYDHIAGLSELRQSLMIGELKTNKVPKLLLPDHILDYLEDRSPFNGLLEEGFISAYHSLVRSRKIRVLTMKPGVTYKLKNKTIKIMVINNIHGSLISSSILIIGEKYNILYLADANKLDDEIYRIGRRIGGYDIVLAHTPFLKRKGNHIGIKDLLRLKAKMYVISHFSHKTGMTHEEIVKYVKINFPNKNIIVARDGLAIEFPEEVKNKEEAIDNIAEMTVKI